MTDVAMVAAGGRYLVALVLFAAGVSKLLQFARFRHAVGAARLFRAGSAAVILVGIPTVELLLPIWLVGSSDSGLAAGATVALLLAFTIYIFVLRSLGREGACGCFGGTAKITDPFVARNLGLACLVAAGFSHAGAIPFVTVGATLLGFTLIRTWRPRRQAMATSA